jgi:hypothetical protein
MVIQSRTASTSRRVMLSIALLLLGTALTGFFGIRAYRAYDHFNSHAPTTGMTDVEAIRGWMTVPYIARAYGVPADALFAALGIPQAGNDRLSVKQLVAKYGRDPLATRQAIQQVLLREQRTPTPG